MDTRCFVLLLSGEGARLLPYLKEKKQFYAPKGKPLFLYPLETAISSGLFSSFVLVVDKEDKEKVAGVVSSLNQGSKKLSIVCGGRDRNESVSNSLKALKEQGFFGKVYLHDADRVFLSVPLLRRLADKENAYDALTPVLPLSDSLLKEEEGKILYQERKNRYLVETPQVFTFEKILAVYESGYDSADTDDFQKAVRAGLSSGLVEGESLDFKLTSREDLSLLEKLL